MKEYKHLTLETEIAEINSKLFDLVKEIENSGLSAIPQYHNIGLYYCKRKQLKRQYRTLTTPEDFTRVNSDSNGNPRYVCHFLNLIHKSEMSSLSISDQYSLAVKRSHKFGGRKYHNKKYGGGLVFQTYNIHNLCEAINNYMEKK